MSCYSEPINRAKDFEIESLRMFNDTIDEKTKLFTESKRLDKKYIQIMKSKLYYELRDYFTFNRISAKDYVVAEAVLTDFLKGDSLQNVMSILDPKNKQERKAIVRSFFYAYDNLESKMDTSSKYNFEDILRSVEADEDIVKEDKVTKSKVKKNNNTTGSSKKS